MSSFRWGMKAYPTPTNSQVTVWKLRQPLFSQQIRIVLLTALHSEVQLGSAGMPLHFDLSLCNLLEYSRPPYISWKRTQIPFIWGMVAWSAPSGCRNMAPVSLLNAPPSYSDSTLPWLLTFQPGICAGVELNLGSRPLLPLTSSSLGLD